MRSVFKKIIVSNSLVTVILSIVVSILVSLPIFHSSFFPVHDFTHVARIEEMHRAIQDGHFPVRWSKNFGYGYGMPLFNFYGPFPYYCMEIPRLIGFSSIDSLKIFIFSLSLFGFWGMYAYSSKLFGKQAGLLSAVAWTVIPYRALDIYVRGALNELTAVTFVLWTLYAIESIREKHHFRTSLLMGLSLFGLMTSHNLMTILFVPILAVYALVRLSGVAHKKSMIFKTLVGFLFGVGLSAFFLFPAFFEKDITRVDTLTGGYSNYVYHFLYIRQLFLGGWGFGGSILGLHDDMSFQVGNIHLFLAACGFIALFLIQKKYRLFSVSLCVLMGISAFMTLFKSQWIWDRVSILAYFQFPWRFLSVLAVFVPVFSGAAIFLFPQRFRVLALGLFIVMLCAWNLQFFRAKEYLVQPELMYSTDEYQIRRQMSDILPDYIPKSMHLPVEAVDQRYSLHPSAESDTLLIDRTHEMLMQYTASEPIEMSLHIVWFPDWSVYIDGTKVSLEKSVQTGEMIVQLPVGSHQVSARLEESPLRLLSNAISIIATICGIGVFVYASTRRD